MQVGNNRHNLQEIKSLNQRGGRMLSIIDLLEAGTVSLKMAGFFTRIMMEDFSFLTAAGPGGTGKTTMMGCLLNLLPPEVQIETFTSWKQSNHEKNRIRYIVHEINQAPYYGYLWGRDVGRFFSLAGNDRVSLAATLHADTLEEISDTLLQSSLRIQEEDLLRIDLVILMKKEEGFLDPRRWVSRVYGSRGEDFALLYIRQGYDAPPEEIDLASYLKYLEKNRDTFSSAGDQIGTCCDFIEKLKKKGIRTMEEVRGDYIHFYRNFFQDA